VVYVVPDQIPFLGKQPAVAVDLDSSWPLNLPRNVQDIASSLRDRMREIV
jgi:hypothetical protein